MIEIHLLKTARRNSGKIEAMRGGEEGKESEDEHGKHNGGRDPVSCDGLLHFNNLRAREKLKQ